jgi:hypothetical protein
MAISHPDTQDAEADHSQHPADLTAGPADQKAGARSTLALISDARQALGEARTPAAIAG